MKNGRPQAVGTDLVDTEIDGVLEELGRRMNWSTSLDKGEGSIRRGRGIGVGFKASISPTTSVAIVNVNADGSVVVHCSTTDMGQGSDTVMAQIAAEVLDVQIETVIVVHPDTDVTPYDMSTLGSRSTYHMGHAVRIAATKARDKLAEMADELGLPEGHNVPVNELFIRKFGMQAGNVVGSGDYKPQYAPTDHDTGQSPNATPYWMIGACGVEVSVDTETGHVTIDRMVNVADLGTALNPEIVATQISGAAVMQLGFTMTEDMVYDAGQVTNANLADYKILGFFDIPFDIENAVIEAEQKSGPFGAKGVVNPAPFGVSPAIASAVEDAVGVRITDMPLTPEKVFRALREVAGQPLQEAEMSTEKRTINFTLNGRAVSAEVALQWNMVEMLQNSFGPMGARESCGQGLCGCCTVLIDGQAATGCLQLAALVDGKDVQTIESPEADGKLSAEQQAFIETGGFQCGYCTPGMILMSKKLLDENPEPTDDDVRHYLSGNLCRCAAYPEIIDAVKRAGEL